MRDDSVIALNMYEEFWTEISVRKALRKIMSKRAIPLEEDRTNLLGVEKVGWGPDAIYKPVYKPLVIKYEYFDYYKYKTSSVVYSDNGVFLRDKSTCQYWHYYKLVDGKPVPAPKHQHVCKPSELTIDHVLPVSRDGKTNDFTNTVCACRYCNEIIKKNQTPEEAGLELIRQPKEPHRVKGDVARAFFVYNPSKPAHRAYNEFLMRRKNG